MAIYKARVGDVVAGPCDGDIWLVLADNKITRIRGNSKAEWTEDTFGESSNCFNHNWISNQNWATKLFNIFDVLKEADV